jgi:hypothetical protein
MRRGWTDSDVAKLAGENLLRVMAAAEKVSAKSRAARPASRHGVHGAEGALIAPHAFTGYAGLVRAPPRRAVFLPGRLWAFSA